jgi:hypothetical protein
MTLVEADFYNREGTSYAAAWASMSKHIHPPSYPPSLEGFEYELKVARTSKASITPTELADMLIEKAKKRSG